MHAANIITSYDSIDLVQVRGIAATQGPSISIAHDTLDGRPTCRHSGVPCSAGITSDTTANLLHAPASNSARRRFSSIDGPSGHL